MQGSLSHLIDAIHRSRLTKIKSFVFISKEHMCVCVLLPRGTNASIFSRAALPSNLIRSHETLLMWLLLLSPGCHFGLRSL